MRRHVRGHLGVHLWMQLWCHLCQLMMRHEVGAFARVVPVHRGAALLGRVQHHGIRRLVLLVWMLLLVAMLMRVRNAGHAVMRVCVQVRRRLMLKMLRLRLR